MPLFDTVNFNGEVFDGVLRETLNLKLNQLLKSGAIVNKPQYAAMLPDQKGGHYVVTLIKQRLKGGTTNYDGKTDITAESRGNYMMGRIVIGRAQGWTEKDFNSDISGDDYSAAIGEVAEFWDDVDQAALISTLKGVFAMTGAKNADFVSKHTYDITGEDDPKFSETTLNTAIQKALGDNKSKFALTIMHSQVATNVENKKLVAYMKYTDAEGVEKDLTLMTLNGRAVLVDDDMPYDADTDTYTTYVLGEGAIEYTDCGVKTPSEMYREPAKNGGETTLYTRQRKVFAPFGISFKNNSIISPTNEQLETGSNWELAKNSEDGTAYPEKAIAIAQIKTKG
jgi:hypothetical protein